MSCEGLSMIKIPFSPIMVNGREYLTFLFVDKREKLS